MKEGNSTGLSQCLSIPVHLFCMHDFKEIDIFNSSSYSKFLLRQYACNHVNYLSHAFRDNTQSLCRQYVEINMPK